MIQIVVAINMDRGARQAAAVDQAGMVEGVAEDGILFAGESTDGGEVGGVTAAENEGGLRFLPVRQCTLKGTQWRQMPGHQRRRSSAATITASGASGGASQASIRGESEGIVGGGGEQFPAAQTDTRHLSRLQTPPDAVQSAAEAFLQIIVHPVRHKKT